MEYRSINGETGRRSFVTVLTLLTTVLVTATFIGVFAYGADLHGKANKIIDGETVQTRTVLPKSFVLPDAARTPVKDQMHRGTCWVFSTMGVAESSYKKNGVAKGYLAEDEYVSFSEQAYGIGFVRYCQSAEGKKDPFCFAGPAKNQTHDGEPEWLYYMGAKVAPYVLPDAVCPYQPDDEQGHEWICPGFDEAVKKNPLSFKVNTVKSAYTIDQIKRLLVEKQTALAWSHSIYAETYVVPCSDNNTGMYGSQQCVKCEHPCTISKDGCCAEIVSPPYTNQGVFSMHGWPHLDGGHAMMVVGYSDEFRVDNGLPGQLHEDFVGGLIIKNSWGSSLGHSAGYWAQEHSLTDENFICPVEASSVTWLPANETCMIMKKDPVACAPGLEKIVRKNWIKGATVLKCTGVTSKYPDEAKMWGWTGCKEGWNYVLVAGQSASEAKVTVPAESEGVLRFHLVGWDATNPDSVPIAIETGSSTWYGMERLLTPATIIGNSEQCGFFFVPYDVFHESNARYPAEGHDTFSISYLDIQWDDSSYAKGKRNSAKDYSLIEASTKRMKISKFVGPFDWNAAV